MGGELRPGQAMLLTAIGLMRWRGTIPLLPTEASSVVVLEASLPGTFRDAYEYGRG